MAFLKSRFHTPWIHAAVLMALSLPYVINLGVSAIWDANEAFYAETPREMLSSGDYLAPHFNFQPRVQKPPLTYWAILASYKIFGVNEFAVRFPGMLAAIGVLLFAYAMARLLFSPRAALFAAAITATTARIFILQRRLPIDMLLLFFLAGAMFFLLLGIHKQKRIPWFFFYLFVSGGFMTKGPVAVFIPLATLLVWMFYNRKSGLPALHPFMGLAVFFCVSLPYYLLIFKIHGWTYISPFFLSDNAGRFVSENFGPSRSFFYYIPIALSDFFPWSFIGIICVYLLWRRRHTQSLLKYSDYSLLILWCVVIFLFFSLSRNKQEYYIAPIYPIAAVLIAGVLDKYGEFHKGRAFTGTESRDDRFLHLLNWFYGPITVLLLAFSLLLPIVLAVFIPHIMIILRYAPSAILLAGVGLMIFHIKNRIYVGCFAVLATSLWIMYLSGAIVYVPALESVRPVKQFCRRIEALGCFASGEEAGYFRTTLPSMVFYLKRPIFEETGYARMTERFRSQHRVFCILSGKDYAYFADRNLNLHILDRRQNFSVRFGNLLGKESPTGKELLLVSNQSYSKIPCR